MSRESLGQRAARLLQDEPSRRRLFLLLVALAAFLPYLNSLGGEFVWDDPLLIRDNRYVKEWRYIPRLFTESMGAGTSGGRGDIYSFWRPLPMLTLAANHALFGLEPFGYHLTNLLLHALTGAAVFWLAGMLAGDAPTGLLAALLWAVHPIHTEVVAYVSGRDSGLGTLLIVVSAAAYVKARGGGIRRWQLAALAAFALALMSKESAAALPLLLLAYEAVFHGPSRIGWGRLAPFAALDLAYVWAKLTVLGFDLGSLAGRSVGLFHRVTGFFASLPAYARLLLAPRDQHVDYGFVRYPLGEPVVLAGIALFGAMIAAALALRRRSPPASFALAWIVLGLVIYAGFYPANAYMAEHWLSTPSVGIFLLAAIGLKRVMARAPAPGPAVLGAIALAVLGLGALTARQNRYWSDPLTFFERSISLAPAAHLPEWYYNLGNHHLDRGDFPRAAEAYRESAELAPGFDLPAVNLAVIYERQGRYDEAEASLGRALRANPRNALAWRNLGVLHLRRGDLRLALGALREARRLGQADRELEETLGALERGPGAGPGRR